MGMPLTSFRILATLATRPDPTDVVAIELREILQKFRLFSFILHDPQRDTELHDVLTRDFEVLDRITGRELLFFALVEPPRDWAHEAQDRHYFSEVARILNVGYARPTPLAAPSPDISLLAAATALGIPTDELPCIVTFTSHSQGFCWQPTSASTLENQLGRIAAAAREIDPFEARIGDYLDRRFNMAELGTHARLTNTVTSKLCETLSGLAQHYLGSDDAKKLNATTRIRLRDQLVTLRQQSPDGEPPAALVQAALELVLLMGIDGRTDWPWEQLQKDRLERETSATLSSLLQLEAVRDLDDWSPLALCYGKALENELNASLVQDMRHFCGIEMPTWYRKHKPRADAVIRTRHKQVDLNKKADRNRWLPPGLGESHAAARTLNDDKKWQPIEPVAWNALLENWQQVYRIRNRAAHTELTSGIEFQQCRQAFNKLAELALPSLLVRKLELRRG